MNYTQFVSKKFHRPFSQFVYSFVHFIGLLLNVLNERSHRLLMRIQLIKIILSVPRFRLL